MIDSTEFGSITANGKKYEHDIVINSEGTIKKGWLQTRHLIGEKEFYDFSKENPEVIIIGNGQYGACDISDDFLNLAEENKIEVIVTNTPDAIKRFNKLVKSEKKIVAYMHVTC